MNSSRDNAKERISRIIKRFEKYRQKFSKDEEQTKISLLNPFWEALGWNVRNPDEVQFEQKVREPTKGGGLKRVDYAFKINGRIKFIVEAKPPQKDLRNPKIINQLTSYGWNIRGVDIGILQDFEEFRVFDVGLKPDINKPERGLIKKLDIRFTDYLDEFDLIYDTFSKEAVLSGSSERLIPATRRRERERESIDKSFFEDLMQWRIHLAKDIIKQNPDIDEFNLNEVTNIIILRVLFLRVVEDREIQSVRMDSLLRQWEHEKFPSLYDRLVGHFRRTEPKYNGGLFKPHLVDRLVISDSPLHEFLSNLYPPACDYRFDLMPVELLGNVYEKFLGTVIRITPKRWLKSELKPEVRKAGGVYYTPKYIVDYIVKETVGKLIEGKTPDEILGRSRRGKGLAVNKGLQPLVTIDTHPLAVVDPACGSGSFLVGAYECIYDYLLKWYREHPRKVKRHPLYGPDYISLPGGVEKLGLHIKRSILVNNLFGVDIDKQATEVTIFSLYVKLMEGEGPFMFKGVLPDLSGNIKCGNSLIGTDILDERPALFDDRRESMRVNPFDWERAFPQVFAGGIHPVGKGIQYKGIHPWGVRQYMGIHPWGVRQYKGIHPLVDRAYHITFVTHNSRVSERMMEFGVKVGEPVILNDEKEVEITRYIAQIVKEDRLRIVAYNICRDHVHMVLVCAEEQRDNIVRKLKGKSTQLYKQNHNISGKFSLWAQKYSYT